MYVNVGKGSNPLLPPKNVVSVVLSLKAEKPWYQLIRVIVLRS